MTSIKVTCLSNVVCQVSLLLLGCLTRLLGSSEAWRFLSTFPGKFAEQNHSFSRFALPLGERAYKSQDAVFTSFSLSGQHNQNGSHALPSWLLGWSLIQRWLNIIIYLACDGLHISLIPQHPSLGSNLCGSTFVWQRIMGHCQEE